ncbi:MAG: hypothetical protein GY719_24770 [bacterium]|nr:hypothetical protein [bacterium]
MNLEAQGDVFVAPAARLPSMLAAVDMGSNSFRMVIARVVGGASLHEIGISIAHGGFHKHGAYLIDHSDMPGFSLPDQKTLSLLVRGVRRKIPKALFAELPEAAYRVTIRLCLLLRLGCLLNRSRSQRTLPEIAVRTGKRKIELAFPAGWLTRHPLTGADLEQERTYLRAINFKLRVRELKEP